MCKLLDGLLIRLHELTQISRKLLLQHNAVYEKYEKETDEMITFIDTLDLLLVIFNYNLDEKILSSEAVFKILSKKSLINKNEETAVRKIILTIMID